DFRRLASATQVEFLIPKNVYGIEFVTTVTWSKDLSAPGDGIGLIQQFQPGLISWGAFPYTLARRPSMVSRASSPRMLMNQH
ncbi:hypothetical protein CSPX01_00121, partial [Colletotrichum filicis]